MPTTTTLRKGQQTRAAIVTAALEQAARTGLEGLTIGALAEQMHMSKSGVFAHFGSREDLQIAVLKAYESRFIEEILKPSLVRPRGLPRLLAIVSQWLERTVIEAALGCIWISSASEYDDRPGAVRDELVSMVQGWQQEISRAVGQSIEAGHLRPDTDVDEVVFGLYGVILVLHHDARLMRSAQALPRARRAIGTLLRQSVTPDAPDIDSALRGAAATPRAPAAQVPQAGAPDPHPQTPTTFHHLT